MKLLILVAGVALASSGFAATYVVDAAGGPGSQFTSISTAIAATVPGDVLIVRPGTYPPFTVDRGIVLVGNSSVVVTGSLNVTSIPAGTRAALAGFKPSGISVTNCDGAVLLQDMTSSNTTTISNALDVRVTRLQSVMPVTQPVSACEITSARVEFLDSTLTGRTPPDAGAVDGANGTRGLGASNAAVFCTKTTVRGGNGQFVTGQGVSAGDGAEGVSMFGSTTLRLVGSSVYGGSGAWNWYYTDCDHDGGSLAAIYGGTLFLSTSSVTAYPFQFGVHCILVPATQYSGVSVNPITPDDPALIVNGAPLAGNIVTFEVSGPLGSSVDLVLGRACVVQGAPPTVAVLTSRDRVLTLGAIPASGKIQLSIQLPVTLPIGTVIVSQAEVTLPGGELRRTNSAPIIVR